MKRLHVHVAVRDLDESIRFYSTLFATEPAVRQPDYAKWMLEDPRVNFAISSRSKDVGLDHLGIQAETPGELAEIGTRLEQAGQPVLEQKEASCCYARSDKAWISDPTGIAWETFHTTGQITTYGEDTDRTAPAEKASACCARPAA